MGSEKVKLAHEFKKRNVTSFNASDAFSEHICPDRHELSLIGSKVSKQSYRNHEAQ